MRALAALAIPARACHLTCPPRCPLPTGRSCRGVVTKLERIPAEAGLFISPLTLQGYRSEADLVRHVRRVEGHLQALLTGAPLPAPAGMQPPGWKPPPPPGPPPPSALGGAPGYGRQHQQQRQQYPPRHGAGQVMVPR